MSINPSSLAAGNLVGIENTQFKPGAQVLQRKIVIIGTFDPAKVGVIENVPVRIFSKEEAAANYGDGSLVHRLAIKTFLGSKGLETWVVPQAEAGGAVVADGKLELVGVATSKGTYGIYIAGELYATVPVAIGDTATVVTAAIIAALNGNSDQSSPLLQVVNGVNDFETDFTSKAKGTYGNDIDISLNLEEEEAPAGLVATITPMANGLTDPDIQDALDALGTDDDQNGKNFTALVNGYGNQAATLDKISEYNGEGNAFEGNYSKTVARPFRTLVGDVAIEDAALAALIVISDARLEDRTNGVIAVPGSQNHPSEIAALALGDMELTNTTRAEETYIDRELTGIRGGEISDRWTSKYDNRDEAVKKGVSPTLVKNGVVTMQNVVSFYRPAAVAPESNGYRSMRNISIVQNLLFNQKFTFEQPKWKGVTIVENVSNVSNLSSRSKARDVSSVLDELVGLANTYAGFAWLFSASFTIDKLKEGDKVVLRPAGNGFDIEFPIILSGEGGILNQVIKFDTSLAVFL